MDQWYDSFQTQSMLALASHGQGYRCVKRSIHGYGRENCKSTVNLIPGDEIAADDEGESESRVLLGKRRCPMTSAICALSTSASACC